jgi:hypothetical protein
MSRFLTSRVQLEVGGNWIVERVFHVSAPPTVTTGFIAIAFDIKKAGEVKHRPGANE